MSLLHILRPGRVVRAHAHALCRIPHSDHAKELVNMVAQRHPHTKFVSIVGDKCIENLPDSRLPMFIIYRKGEVLNQLVSWGADRQRRVDILPSRWIRYKVYLDAMCPF